MNEKHIILPMRRIPSVSEFLEALQIKPTGFASQLFKPIYNQFFVWSTNLRNEYERYYCVEYPTLANYLESAHEIYLDQADLEKGHILKIKPPSGVLDEAYDDNVQGRVIDCIRMLENSGEN